MNKKNLNAAKIEEPPAHMTRAQSEALRVVGGNGICFSSKPSFKQDHKRVVRVKSKRAASDKRKSSATATLGLLHKRRAVLKDIVNISTQSLSMDCINSSRSKIQSRRGVNNNSEITANVSMLSLSVEDVKARLVEELSRVKMVEAQEIKFSVMMEDTELVGLLCHSSRECAVVDAMPPIKAPKVPTGIDSHQKKKENEASRNFPDIVDIDSDLKGPQGCSL
ncbi:hypothetical protein SLEP1_g12510 [Rubroshorea leprosula]|uniref:Uncharacterized protein n=1 Tax=Rubroshorea leprosula TaxID=152421 RepID=A0AAV5ICT0_9ROSI|nr:hypothetical protein SLEP1_g12510 [Rubroshorea leprosula]